MISISCRKAVCTAILLLTTRPGPATPHGVTEVINADDTTYKDIITITDTPQTHSLVANKTLHFSGVANSSATTLTFVYDTTKIFTPVFSFVTPQNSPQVGYCRNKPRDYNHIDTNPILLPALCLATLLYSRWKIIRMLVVDWSFSV